MPHCFTRFFPAPCYLGFAFFLSSLISRGVAALPAITSVFAKKPENHVRWVYAPRHRVVVANKCRTPPACQDLTRGSAYGLLENLRRGEQRLN